MGNTDLQLVSRLVLHGVHSRTTTECALVNCIPHGDGIEFYTTSGNSSPHTCSGCIEYGKGHPYACNWGQHS